MKQYVVTASQMKRYDTNTMEKFKMPGILLMERAALATVEILKNEPETKKILSSRKSRILVVAGGGNNGGDGLAAGRLLMLAGCRVDFVILGKPEKRTADMDRQTAILKEYGAAFFDRMEAVEYDIVIDAIFGTGLSRKTDGEYRHVIEEINNRNAFVCSMDIPSGINADTGAVMGCAVKADLTVSYAFYKMGQLLYPGASYCGRLVCCDIGIDGHSFLEEPPVWYTHTDIDGLKLPVRRRDGNKGTFGKALVIAGSSSIYGAAFLAAKSCFRVGAGMVKIITAVENRESLQQSLPEAMLDVYRENMTTQEEETFLEILEKDLKWADCILAGPGMGTGEFAERMLTCCVEGSGLPLVLDADALNLLAQNPRLQTELRKRAEKGGSVILTPHIGEFARLCGMTAKETKDNFLTLPSELSEKLCCTVVCKDARTTVVDRNSQEKFLNTTGNEGMATAGSGDVLAGMICGLVAQKEEGVDAAVAGVVLHGMAGESAADKYTKRAMTASDIVEQIPAVLGKRQDD